MEHRWNKKYSFLANETVLNSTHLTDFLENNEINIVDIQKVYIQIFNALNVAYKLFKYKNQDLHTSNILVREFESNIKINIYDDNMKIIGQLSSKYVPYIIDYGANVALIDNVVYESLTSFYSNKNCELLNKWGYDINILLYHTCKSNQESIIKFAEELWTYIYKGKEKSINSYYKNNYLSVEYNDQDEIIIDEEHNKSYYHFMNLSTTKSYANIVKYIINKLVLMKLV